jgi:hypothetical protein
MQRLRPALSALAALLCAAPFASAGQIVEITVTGTVEYDAIAAAPLGLVADGEPATLRFRVDSDSFVNSPSFPTRGYVIDKSSFSLSFDSATVALPSPYPAGQTPYFVIRNNDPGVDGFMLSADVDDPVGVPLSQIGFFGNLTQSFYVTYGGTAPTTSPGCRSSTGPWTTDRPTRWACSSSRSASPSCRRPSSTRAARWPASPATPS